MCQKHHCHVVILSKTILNYSTWVDLRTRAPFYIILSIAVNLALLLTLSTAHKNTFPELLGQHWNVPSALQFLRDCFERDWKYLPIQNDGNISRICPPKYQPLSKMDWLCIIAASPHLLWYPFGSGYANDWFQKHCPHSPLTLLALNDGFIQSGSLSSSVASVCHFVHYTISN